jgi:hypothetical protein
MLYLFLFGAELGVAATSAWLYSVLISFIQSYGFAEVTSLLVLRLGPSIYVHTCITEAVAELRREVHDLLHHSSTPSAYSVPLQWHVDGVHRAAAHFPSLMTSQILSLLGNTHAVPHQSHILGFGTMITVSLPIIFAQLPQSAQQFVFVTLVPAVCSGFALLVRRAFAWSVYGGIAVLVGAALMLLILFQAAWTCLGRYTRIRTRRLARDDEYEVVDHESLDTNCESKLNLVYHEHLDQESIDSDNTLEAADAANSISSQDEAKYLEVSAQAC